MFFSLGEATSLGEGKIDLMSHPARAVGLVNRIGYKHSRANQRYIFINIILVIHQNSSMIRHKLKWNQIDKCHDTIIGLNFPGNMKHWSSNNDGHKKKKRCPWCNGYCRRKWTRWQEFKSWTRQIAFHIALIPLGKVWIQLFSLQLLVNSRTDYVVQPW